MAGLNLLSALAPKISPADAPTMEPFVAPDMSGMTDREIIEANYVEAARARHYIEQMIKQAAASPLLSSMVPRL